MALVKCKECGNEVSKKATACPKCGAPGAPGFSIVRVLVGVLVVLIGGPLVLGAMGALSSHAVGAAAGVGMDGITAQVAKDAVAQYEIAKRGSDPMQTCVQAGMVVAAFLQAKDEPNVHRWQSVEKADCGRAGMPKP
ncbi:MAG: zinc ribbon domain-containing protein [Polyangiaceae bacterium]